MQPDSADMEALPRVHRGRLFPRIESKVITVDLTKARYVQMRHRDGQFVIALLDEERREIGFGYKGPTPKRAQLDLKYWTKDKGLIELPD